ncbi:hypothetical protein [Kitasatospora sp. KL5]|uniref:hypothetical protein n=1 Tax=Kitasatospora sp. KL5 TaxID=3425125 RepID=UPI003D6E3947
MTRQGASRPHDPEDAPAGHEAQDRRVLAGADFPLYAAEGLPSRGAADRDSLAGYEVVDGRLGWVELRSGDWGRPQGPYVSVRTHRPADPAGPERALPELEDAVEDERDRVYDQLDVDEGDGPGRTRALRGWITVDGEPCPVQIHEDRRPDAPGAGDAEGAPIWAGRLHLGGVAVTVIARGLPPAGVELRRVTDVEPFVRGRTALALSLAERQQRRAVPVEERELPAVIGLEAHRAVVEHGIHEAFAMEAQLCSRRTGRIPRRLRGEAGAERWEAAVRQQMRLASESREEAVEAVSAMVNQLTRLAQRTDWLVGTAEGEAAVAESVRYTAFDSEVPSLAAQRAWGRLWAGGAPGGADAAEEAWLEAWEDWRGARR